MSLSQTEIEVLQSIDATGALPVKNGNEPAQLARHRFVTAYKNLETAGYACAGPSQNLVLTTNGKEFLAANEPDTRE